MRRAPYRSLEAPRVSEWSFTDPHRVERANRLALGAISAGGVLAGVAGLPGQRASVVGACVVVGLGLLAAWVRARNVARVVLQIAAGEATLRRGGRVVASLSFAALDDVVLDTKSGDTRIVLVTRERALPLSEGRVPHGLMEGRFADLRRFLRVQGWVPKDERPGETE